MNTKSRSCSLGIEDSKRLEITKALSHYLADTYTLYLKTQNYHWNVEGTLFTSLHLMFEGQYTALAGAVDTIAERIRALGELTPGSFSEFLTLASIPEAKGHPEALDMVRDLLQGHESLICAARKIIETADAANDASTSDMLTTLLEDHEKTAWMLRAVAA